MQKMNPHLKRAIIGIVIAIVVFFAVLIIFISPIAKYLIQKYDDIILGRKIELGWIYINPLTGYVHIHNLRVYEHQSDSLFFTAESVSADMSMSKLFKKTYEINSISVDKPWGRIIQDSSGRVNFQDIIDHYRRKDTTARTGEPTHFNILNCAINDGEFHYDERSIPVTYFIKNVYIKSPGKWWNLDTMSYQVALLSGPTSGAIKGSFLVNFKELTYGLKATVDSFDLKPLDQYMRELSNYGNFGGWVDAKVEGEGKFRDKLALKTRGIITIKKFQYGPSIHEDYGSFQRLVLDIKEADPGGKKYQIDSIMLDRPYFRYERYDSLDNLTRMFGKVGTKPGIHSQEAQFNLILKIAEYLQELIKNFAQSDYYINKFTLYKGDVIFNDYSLREKFSVDGMPVFIRADSINKREERMKITANATLKPFGHININVSLDPNDYGYFDVNYKIHKVPVSLFNPYLITYTSFPLDRGTMEVSGDWDVEDSIIKSTNHLLIMDARVGKKVKRNDTKWIPLPLIMSVARDAGEVIDYEIPVYGNLKSPKFRIHDVVMNVLRNIFIKPPSTPYLVNVKKLENTIEKMLTLKWEMRQTSLTPVQEKFIAKMARFLKKNPDYSINVLPNIYADREKEHITLFEGKKKFFLSSAAKGHQMTEDDSLKIEQMSIKDSFFVHYLDKHIGDSMMFTAQEKCRYILGDNFIEARFMQLNKSRENIFLAKFIETGTAGQVKFVHAKMGIPYNGFSCYKIDYNGNVPDELQKAYEEMTELNNEGPRKKYNNDRWMPKVKGIKKVSEAN